MTLRQLRAPAVIALLALAAACGKSSAPTPVAVATPTPAPAPSAAATPRVFSCPYPALPDLHNTCPKLAPELDRYVNNAVEDVVAKHPELFDFTNNLGCLVRDRALQLHAAAKPKEAKAELLALQKRFAKCKDVQQAGREFVQRAMQEQIKQSKFDKASRPSSSPAGPRRPLIRPRAAATILRFSQGPSITSVRRQSA